MHPREHRGRRFRWVAWLIPAVALFPLEVSAQAPGEAEAASAKSSEADAGEVDESEAPIPRAYPVSRYLEIWKNSPFELEAAPVMVASAQKTFANDYTFAGMLKKGDEPVVYLINKKTRETVRVTREGRGGFRLVEIEEGDSARDVEVTVEKDGQKAKLSYEQPTSLAQAGKKGGPGRSGSNPAGQGSGGQPRGLNRTGSGRASGVGQPASSSSPPVPTRSGSSSSPDPSTGTPENPVIDPALMRLQNRQPSGTAPLEHPFPGMGPGDPANSRSAQRRASTVPGPPR